MRPFDIKGDRLLRETAQEFAFFGGQTGQMQRRY
jgi:hypothetical protein